MATNRDQVVGFNESNSFKKITFDPIAVKLAHFRT
jgi:hypothetical protein